MGILELLKPKSSGIFQQRHQRSIDVESHDCLEPTNELPTDEDGWDRLLLSVAHQLIQDRVNLLPSLLFIKLVDGGAHAEAKEEAFGHMAHAAAA